jgi:hypothetical protein
MQSADLQESGRFVLLRQWCGFFKIKVVASGVTNRRLVRFLRVRNFQQNCDVVGLREEVSSLYIYIYIYIYGARGSVVVRALCFKPESRGFETR